MLQATGRWIVVLGALITGGSLVATAAAQPPPSAVPPELVQQAQDACRTLQQVDPKKADELCGTRSSSDQPSSPRRIERGAVSPRQEVEDRHDEVDQACRSLKKSDPETAEILCRPRPQESAEDATRERGPIEPALGVPPKAGESTDRSSVVPTVSELERFFRTEESNETPVELSNEPLKQFGYALFQDSETTTAFTPGVDVPVSPDYVIGPADEFTITIWGLVDGLYKVQVDRNGEITLPRAGVIPVAGLRYDELRPFLERHLAKYYQDFHLSVGMGRLRSIRVYVVGEAVHPGSYTLSALSTAYHALFAAGGPTKRGSLRKMQVIRGGKTTASIDLYDFLMKGDRTQDVKLQHEDTILVPLIGSTVAVSGNVVRPAIYEMKDKASLADALRLAGGPRPTADLNRVQIERVEAHEQRIAVDLDLSRLDEAAAVPIRNMDVVKVFPIQATARNVVRLGGHVVRAGEYQFKPGMRVRDIIPSYEQFLPEPSLEYSEIIRYERPTMARTVLTFSIQEMMAGNPRHNLDLQDRDEIRIYPAARFRDPAFVTISGAVRHPGRYRLYHDMTVLELVRQAGDPTPDAFTARSEIRRKVQNGDAGFAREVVYFQLDRLLEGDEAERKALAPDDEVVITAKNDVKVLPHVKVSGEVKRPGSYPLMKGMRVKDLVFQGGLTRESATSEAELVRFTPSSVAEQGDREVMPIDLARVLADDPAQNMPLQGDDELLVKQVGELKRQYRVSVEGEVQFPGSYVVRSGERMSSLIRRAGGFTDKAYLRGAIFTRESVRASQELQLQEFTNAHTQRVTAEAASLAMGGLSKDEAEAARFELSTRQEAVKLLASKTVLGRVVVRLDQPEALEGGPDDLTLEDGDRLVIPQPPSSVAVLGSVRNPTAVVAHSAKAIKDYVAMAGGYLPNADRKAIYLVKADGSSVSPDEVKTVEAGDAILVPPQMEAKYRPLPLWRDIATIVGQFAIAIAAVVVIF
ncbi:MAG: SLBB domain-containing protein [Nitrospirota bacterium]